MSARAGFDFLFVYWHLMRFAGESPFSHSALDIKTYAMAMVKTGYRDATKRNMPKRWFDDLPHTHVALDDAIEQGALFCNMLRAHVVAGTRLCSSASGAWPTSSPSLRTPSISQGWGIVRRRSRTRAFCRSRSGRRQPSDPTSPAAFPGAAQPRASWRASVGYPRATHGKSTLVEVLARRGTRLEWREDGATLLQLGEQEITQVETYDDLSLVKDSRAFLAGPGRWRNRPEPRSLATSSRHRRHDDCTIGTWPRSP